MFYFDAGLLPEDKYSKQLREYIDWVIDAWSCIYLDGVALVSRKPTVRLNEQERLHHDKLSAVEFKDGYSIYTLNGVTFPEELFKKITSEDVTARDILSIGDIDQRTQAMRFMPPKEMVKELKGEALGEYQKLSQQGEVVAYTLYRFPKGEVFTEDAYYMLMDCPSTSKKHLEGVEVSKTVPQAMAWRHEITQKEWKAMVPLVDEV